MKLTSAFLASAATLLLSSCANTTADTPDDPTPVVDLEAYANSIETAILGKAGLDTTTQACEQNIDWICYISEISASAASVAIVSVQIVKADKDFGRTVARGVYDFAGTEHPQLARVQVTNATDDIIADETFT